MHRIGPTILTGLKRLQLNRGRYSGLACLIMLGVGVASGLLSTLAAWVVTSSGTVGLISAFGPLRTAIDRVEAERNKTEAEIAAFDQFIRRVGNIDPTPAATPSLATPAGAVAITSKSTDDHLDAVEQAYRETIMAVPHFETEYGETLQENMAEELGPEITTTFLTADAFTSQLQTGIIQSAHGAKQKRDPILEMAQTEQQELEAAFETLHHVEERVDVIDKDIDDAGFVDCESKYNRLVSLADDCQGVLNERQRHLHRGNVPANHFSTLEEFHDYLYGPLPMRHPILKTGTAMIERIQDVQQRVVARLGRLK